MQGKGAIRFLAIIFAIACVFALSFTYVSWRVGQKAEEYAGGNKDLEKRYLDSMSTEVVYDLGIEQRSEEHTSELQSLMPTSYTIFCLTNTHSHTTKSIKLNYNTPPTH